jgi:hypothetical protein
MRTTTRLLSAATIAALVLPTLASAQQANASVAAFGMSGTATASATGFEAVSWNPALLGLKSAPKFSIGGLTVNSSAGLGPVTVQDLADYSGAFIPTTVRQGWINDIRSSGAEKGAVDGGVTFVAASWGRFAGSVSAAFDARMNVNADFFEAILLGNAQAVASNRVLLPQGTVRGSGFLTTAVSYGMPVDFKFTDAKDETFSLGVTGKYVLGMADFNAADNGSRLTKDTLKLRLPVLISPTGGGSSGSGVGFDIGAAWHAGSTTIGLAVLNVVNGFAWNKDSYQCNDIKADIDVNQTTVKTDAVQCTGAIGATRDKIADRKFKPTIRGGVKYDASKDWTITGDFQSQTGNEDDAILIGPATAIGVGAEWRGIPMLPLRAGFSSITGGTQFSGGLGLRLGGYEIGAAVQRRTVDSISSTNLMIGLVSFISK